VLSVDEPGRPLLHADVLRAREAGLRDQVRDFLTGELEADSFALMAGAAQGIYAHAARYASERRQFGKPLAAMQAIQQQLAELAAAASAMTVAAEAAAAAVDLDPAESWPLDAARIRIAEAAGAVAAIGHQILGAIGVTDEHPLHRPTTRLWAWREEYGNHAIWSERLGSVLRGKDGLTLWQRMTR
jgi:acyl-CoA dehydrogenase